jgi:hypothetical protein
MGDGQGWGLDFAELRSRLERATGHSHHLAVSPEEILWQRLSPAQWDFLDGDRPELTARFRREA